LNITDMDFLIENLRKKIMYLQEQIVAALKVDDKAALHKALEAQSIGLDALIKIVEANQPKR